MMNQLVAGVVILYYPDESVIENISTYAPFLSRLYVIDNSEVENNSLIEKIKKTYNVHYIKHGENLGISYSLNEALRLSQGTYQWLLTMDQDSKFYQNSVEEYVAALDGVDADVYGICPTYEHPERVGKENNVPGAFKVVEKCVTSGNIINVDIAIKSGGFNEKLFIDEVDNEFCYRCNRQKYKLLKYSKNILLHSIGHPARVNLFGFHFTVLNESPLRQYYIFRNRCYVAKWYPEKRKEIFIDSLKWVARIILGEHKKIKKIKYVVRGIWDFKNNRFGKIVL